MEDSAKYAQIWDLLCKQTQPLLKKSEHDILCSAFVSCEKGSRFVINFPTQLNAKIFSENLFNLVEGILRSQGIKGKISTKIENQDLFAFVEKQKKAEEEKRKNLKKELKNNHLNPNYLFSNFVVGSSNSLAHACALKLSKGIVEANSPLLIYGKSGLGKSHLMNACGNNLLKNGFKQIICMSAVDFVNEYISSIAEQRENEFNHYLENSDALLLDDVQFLAKREKTQEVFFHHFNRFFDQKKPIVLTSDFLPKEIPDLEPRLKTRFGSGITVGIDEPEFEMRMAILKNKAQQLKFFVEDKVLKILAQFVEDNIRELEGALNNLKSSSELSNHSPDEEMAFQILGIGRKEKKEIIKEKIEEPRVEDFSEQVEEIRANDFEKSPLEKICIEVCRNFQIELFDLLGESRNRDFVIPRQLSMYLAREIFSLSYEEIGNFFQGKNKSTVMRACNKTQELISKNNNFFNQVNKIKIAIKNNNP